MGINYFLYARKSSENEDRQVVSIESQVDELKKQFSRQGLNIIEVLTEARSAKSPGRQVFNSMIERIQKGEANGILCWKLDRLARNPIDGGTISWLLQKGVIQEILTYQGSYHPTDNVIMMQVEFGMANQFILDLSVNTKRGMRTKVGNGWFPHKAPPGYLNNKHNLPDLLPVYPDPERFELFQQIWKMLLEQQLSVTELWRFTRDKWKLKTPYGTAYPENTFFRVFRNPFYYGYFYWSGNLYKGSHEPMITKEMFDKAQALLDGRTNLKPETHVFAFTGLMRCGKCGAAITATHRHKEQKNGNEHDYTYYHCTRQVDKDCTQKMLREDRLETQLADILADIEIPSEFHQWAIGQLKEENLQQSQDSQTIMDNHQKALEACNKRLERLFEMRADEELDAIEYKEKKTKELKEKHRIEELITDNQSRYEHWIERAEEYLTFAETARAKLESGDWLGKRTILATLGTKLELIDRKLDLDLEPFYEVLAKFTLRKRFKPLPLKPENLYIKQKDSDDLYHQNPIWGD